MTIIALSGYGTSGKDTVADMLVEKYGFAKYAWADTLRYAAETLDPIVHWDEEFGSGPLRYTEALNHYGYIEAKAKFPEFRRILQYLGTDVGRNLIDDNVWVDATFKRIANERSLSDHIVISDTRFPNEANAVKLRSESQNFVVRITRPNIGPVSDHISETALDDYDFDYVIHNDGSLADLEDSVDRLWVFAESFSQGLRPE